jgi:hypothetical protein
MAYCTAPISQPQSAWTDLFTSPRYYTVTQLLG